MRALLAVLTVFAATTAAAAAEPESPWAMENKEVWRFPDSMKVGDVKKDYGAVGDGKTDDTAALQKALDHRGGFVYFPNGTYLVRDRIRYNQGPGTLPAFQGETRDGVIIRLSDDAKGFDDPRNPRAVIQTVPGEMKDKLSADYFKTKLRNLTIDAGRHKGAIGLVFYANNNGMCRNVRIVGQGAVGLYLERQLNGPLLVSNVEIEGFDVGIKAGSGPYNSQTLEHVVLKNQARYGIENQGECLSIRGVFSTNSVPAICAAEGNMVLLDSELAGGSSANPAIICGGTMFARNIKTEGYGKAIEKRAGGRQGLGEVQESVAGGDVAEWASTPGKSNSAPAGAVKSLNLPVEEAPYVPLDKDFADWVFVDDYGAVPGDKNDDTAAVNKAIEFARKNNKTTLCFGRGEYIMGGKVAIGGSIRRVQGAGTFWRPPNVDTPLQIVVGDDAAPVVMFDMIDRSIGPKLVLNVEHSGSGVLVLRNLRCNLFAGGAGKTFSEDAANRVFITDPRACVWVRQLNSEGQTLRQDVKNENKGGSLWVLGIKTEGVMSVASTLEGGKTEILGGWIYVIGRDGPSSPLFTVKDSRFTAAGIVQWHVQGKDYKTLVDETRGGEQKLFTKDTNDGKGKVVLFSTN